MKAPFTFAIETITWEDCARLVQNCKVRNRKLSVKRVERLARAVTSKRFYITHQGVALDPHGEIIDGQHRFAAHAQSRTDFTGLVSRYSSSSEAELAMGIFDSGRSRSMADGLAIGGTMSPEDSRDLTAVCVVLRDLFGPRAVILDIQEMGDFYKAHKEEVNWCITAIPKKRGGAYVRAAFAMAWKVNKSKTSELAAQIREGAALPGSAAALWNRAFADGLLTTAGGRSERISNALKTLRILKAHICNEDVPKRLTASEDSLKWFLEKLTKKGVLPPAPVGKELVALPGEVAKLQFSRLETKVLSAMSSNGTRVLDIANAVGAQQGSVSVCLMRLHSRGLVDRVSRGVYKVVKAAA